MSRIKNKNMFEGLNQSPQPQSPYNVVVGGGGAHGSGPNWFGRLWQRLLPPFASTRRKVLVIGIPVGVVLLAVGIVAFIVWNSSKEPLTVATEEVDEGLRVDTNGDGEPDTMIPNTEPSNGDPSNNGGGQAGGNSGGSGGSGSNGSQGGGSNGGTSGNGGSNDGGGATTSCPLPAYPNPSCTGVPAGTSLATHNGDFTTSSAGQVIENMRITGDIEVRHDNIIIRKSEVYGHIKNINGSSTTFTVEDSTVGPPSGCFDDAAIGNNNYTVRRVYLRGFAEGVRSEWVTDGGSLTEAGDILVKDSYFKFCNPSADNHGDALQGYHGGPNVVFEHNTVDMWAIPLTNPETYPITAAVFWSDGSADGLVYKNNLVSGGGFTIRIHSGNGHTVTGNRIMNNSWLFGPVSVSNCGGLTWSDNSIVEIDANYNIVSTVGSVACVD